MTNLIGKLGAVWNGAIEVLQTLLGVLGYAIKVQQAAYNALQKFLGDVKTG